MGRLRVLLLVPLAVLLAGPAAAAVRPFPTGTVADYQLGGARPVPAQVGTVVRDRADQPASGRYNVCYLNGFQTQPDEYSFWKHHLNLLLKRNGHAVVDEAWGEFLLDTRTRTERDQIASLVGRWIAGCAAAGYDAVELDNLDSFSRSHGLIKADQNRALARLLVARAHRAGLAAGQKNWSEWDGRVVGYDFAIAEECGRWKECGSYVRNYGSRVLDVEYRDVDLAVACKGWGSRISIVRRDLALSPTGVRRWC